MRANGGGPGVDGEDIAAFERDLDRRLAELARELAAGAYRPRAVRRVFVPKPNDGLRPLAIWTLRDRVVQRAAHAFLEPVFEPGFLDVSHGYRPGRSVDTAVSAVLAARDQGRRWVLETDIQDCFDSIQSDRLLGQVRDKVDDPLVLDLLRQWLGADILDRAGKRGRAGAAQGGVLSPLLCNIYLHPLDVELTRRGIALVRYADDLVCLAPRRADAEEALRVVERSLRGLGMALNPHKTRVVHVDEGFTFLGVFFLRGEHFYLTSNKRRMA